MKRIVLVALAACRTASSDAPAPAPPVMLAGDAGAVVAPAGKPVAPAKERCEQDMPEQSCVPGCEAVPHDCAQGCAITCGTCVDACAGSADCEARCVKQNERCRTADCSKQAADCNAEAAAAKKRNYGCKLPPLAACKKHVACTEPCLQAGPGDPMLRCFERCQKRTATGCDPAFLARAELIGCSEHEAP